MIDLCKKHSMYSWSANAKVSPMPVERAEGDLQVVDQALSLSGSRC